MQKKQLQALTLEQKCALLSGATTFGTRALPKNNIPSITLSDGPNGVRKQAGAADHLGLNPSVPATCFPTSSATACSWDEALGEAVGEALGEEAAAQEVAVLLGPGLNIQRSPLCGRDFEYFSEDPILAGKMAAAYVRGIQKNGISACPKHFAVNSQELRRMASDSVLDERTLRELYLTGFEIVVKEAKPKTIMTSYNLINGTYANENAHLLQDILRKDWGFDGAVVTDWGGSNDHALGVKNGSTLEMPCPGGDSIRELMKAVQDGKISEADVDARLDEMLELASLGAQVLNNRSVELAKKYNVELEVLSSLNPVPGTVVKEVVKDVEGMLIKGVAKDTDVSVITILNVPDEPGTSFKIFGLLAQKNINVDIILQSTGRDGKKDISFTCSEGEADLAMRVLKESAHFNDVSVDTTCAKVSIVGAGMQSHSGVASKMFEALSNNNINIKMISTSEIKISCIIDRADADKAVSAIHDMLFD